jgi:DNA-binding NtrC family response regulator
MAATEKLSPADRELCALVARAAYCNPFSEERLELDAQIAGCSLETLRPRRVELVVARVVEVAYRIESQGAANLQLYSGDDRDVMRGFFLFEIYHRFWRQFDELLLAQVEAGDKICPVKFAPDAIAHLLRRGFTKEEAPRLFAILFQIRRIFYFVDRGLVGQSECMKQLRRRLWNNVFTNDIRIYDQHLWNRMEDFSTLLLGETGVGKGAAAAAIGRSGFIPFDEKRGCFAESFMRSFISLNLSQYPETLIESELFGHRKGAFTGAISDHEGIFARCSPHGAIFLDEIGDISVPVQIKLLQVLQERTFSPVGSHEKLRFRGRVIAATNKPLDELRRTGQFRDDFYYRLCSDTITVPPLRQRIAEEPRELDDLLAFIVRRITGDESGELVGMVREVILKTLGRDYAWPGNVRELEQAVRRILLMRNYEGDHKTVNADLRTQLLNEMDAGTLDADDLLSAYCTLLYQRHGTFEEVARRTNLDRRTVKKYIEQYTAKKL